MNFQHKKIAITGASPDLGQSLGILLAQQGAELFLSARSLDKAHHTAQLITAQQPEAKVHCFKADMTSASEIAAFAQGISELTPSLDILIHNASLWLDHPLQQASDQQLMDTINSTATGSILLTKHLLPQLEASATPDIVFINSTASLLNNQHATCNEAFSAAKAAQATFADRLRQRLKGRGVLVTTIYPPDFVNPSPLSDDWHSSDSACLSARNVFNALQFALTQDRICSVDKIILSNNPLQTP